WLYLTFLMAMMNFSSHGTQDKYKPFLASLNLNLGTRQTSTIIMIGMGGAILGGITFGAASDFFGRRRMMVIAFLGALACIPLWAFSTSVAALPTGAFAMQFMVQGAWGIVPAHINELAPNQVRGFLPGFSSQCGNLIAASIASIQAFLAERHAY